MHFLTYFHEQWTTIVLPAVDRLQQRTIPYKAQG